MSRVIAEGIGTVYVAPKGGGLNMVAFHEGDEVPAWAAEQMGDHCFDGLGKDTEPAEENDEHDAPEPEEPAPAETPEPEAPTQDENDTPAPAADAPDYDTWLNKDLEAEVEKRNQGRDDDDLIVVEGPGNKSDLVAALQADDVAQASANQ